MQLISRVTRWLTNNSHANINAQNIRAIAIGNSLMYSSADLAKLKQSIIYKRCADIVSTLSPMDVSGGEYIRVGRDFDGGYVMLDNLDNKKIDAAYSIGIGNDVSWDMSVADRGIDVYMYDNTINKLPKKHPRFHYNKIGITGYEKGKDLKTLSETISENGHTASNNLILKIDVEGCEWDILKESPSDLIRKFSQIVIEYHGLSGAVYHQKKYDKIVNVLKKINQTHQSVHVHANGTSIPLWIGELVLPGTLEVTYVRRSDFIDRFTKCTRQFPTDIDNPTFEKYPDIYLGGFSVEK